MNFSQAGLILTLDDLSTSGVAVVIVDNVDGGGGTKTPVGLSNHADLSLGKGVISFANRVGALTINFTIGHSGSGEDNLLTLASLNASGCPLAQAK